MKFYLTLLRRDGKRTVASTSPRLVTAELTGHQGNRQLIAHCCFGGIIVAELWDPVLVRVNDEHLTLRGVERSGDAAVVQEWRLRPHSVP